MRTTPVWLVCAALLLSACQSDPGDGMGNAAEPPKTTTTPRPTQSSSEPPENPRPSKPAATPVPTEPQATGPRLTTDVVNLRMPNGWEIDSGADGYYASAQDLRSTSKVTLYTTTLAEGQPSPSLLSMVDTGLRYARKNVSSEARQAPNVRIDGAVAVHVAAKYDDGGNWFDEFDSIQDRRLVTLVIEVDGSAKKRQRVVDSILATWTWQDA